MLDNKKKGIAVIECFQDIPCNPCVTACKAGAISKASLTSCPEIDLEKCQGCKLCVAACPGQAIFLQIRDYEKGFSTITFPYEYLPLPEVGSLVNATDRLGKVICEAEVMEVLKPAAFNKTKLITLKIPAEYADTIRFMKRLKREVQL